MLLGMGVAAAIYVVVAVLSSMLVPADELAEAEERRAVPGAGGGAPGFPLAVFAVDRPVRRDQLGTDQHADGQPAALRDVERARSSRGASAGCTPSRRTPWVSIVFTSVHRGRCWSPRVGHHAARRHHGAAAARRLHDRQHRGAGAAPATGSSTRTSGPRPGRRGSASCCAGSWPRRCPGRPLAAVPDRRHPAGRRARSCGWSTSSSSAGSRSTRPTSPRGDARA